MQDTPPVIDGFKFKPEEFKDYMLAILSTREYFVYPKEDDAEVEKLLDDHKQFVKVYGVKYNKRHIIKVEPMMPMDTVLNQIPVYLRAELKNRFDEFNKNNGFLPDKTNMIDMALKLMNDAQEQLKQQQVDMMKEEAAEKAKTEAPKDQSSEQSSESKKTEEPKKKGKKGGEPDRDKSQN